MRKFLTILFLFGIAHGQVPVIKRALPSVAISDARVYTTMNFAIPKVDDTASALNGGPDSLGLFIQIKSSGLVYHRDTTAGGHKWSLIVGDNQPIGFNDVVDALGYIPYDQLNPNGFITRNDLPNTNVTNGLHARDTNTVALGGILDTPQTKITSDASHLFGIDFSSDATGDLFYRGSDGFWHRLAVGTSKQHLVGGALPHYVDTATTSGSGTVNSGTINQLAYYAAGGTAVSSTPAIPNGITATTQSANDNSTKVATTAYADGIAALKANLASPTFTGTPVLPTGSTAVTQTAADNSTHLATTAYVDRNEFWLVQPTSVSGAASIIVDFSSVYNTFSRVEIYLYGIVPASDNKELQMQVSNDGVTYDGGAGAYTFATAGLASSSSTAANNVSASQTYMSLGLAYGNGAAKSNHCIVKLFANGVASRNVTYGMENHYITSAGSTTVSIGSMSHNSTSTEKFVKIFFPSANISVDSYSVKVFK